MTVLRLDNTAGAYGAVDADLTMLLVYGDWDNDASVYTDPTSTDNFFTGTGISTYALPKAAFPNGVNGTLQVGGADPVAGINLPLKLAIDNSVDLTGGDPANTLLVSVSCLSIVVA